MGTGTNQPEEVLAPVEQATVPFYGRELVAARLADGRIAAVIRWLCEGMGLDTTAQIQRIKRKAALREDLVTVRIETAGGPQAMPALLLHGLPGWLYTIDETRARQDDAREAVIRFQREATDVLAEHFARRPAELTPPPNLVPSEPIARPASPDDDATPEDWLEFHRQMIRWLEWRRDVAEWRARVDQRQDGLEERMESAEAVLQLVPEILDRLGPRTLSPEHQRTVQQMAKRLHEAGGYPYATIYADLGGAFHVGKYDQIPETEWAAVTAWFRMRIQATGRCA
jgi:hypothetical protein